MCSFRNFRFYGLLFCILWYVNTHAQSSNIGFFTYESYSVKDERTRGPTERTLYFNADESLEVVETLVPVYGRKNQNENTIKGLFSRGDNDSIGIRIYRNLKGKQLVTRRPDNPISDAFVVHENWVTIDWKIFPKKTKLIGGFACQKAIGNFRGRTYEAWFAPEIPYPFGPWKLHGLPGLILEARDLKGKVWFEFYDHDYPSSVDDKMIAVPTEGEVITHQQEVDLLDRFDEIVTKKLNERSAEHSRFTLQPKKSKGRLEDAWELIYEWEK
jgi:GLPGLI family protein